MSLCLASGWIVGINAVFSTPRPVLDQHQRIIAMLVGQPHNPTYLDACEEALKLLEQERDAAAFTADEERHR